VTEALDSIENGVMRESVAAWFETHGAVAQKYPAITIRRPNLKANRLQRIISEIIKWCEANGIPTRIIGLKARQVGLSTFSMAGAYHACRKQATRFLLIGDEYEKSVANLESMFWLYAAEDQFAWGNEHHKPSGTFTNGSKFVTDTANDNRAGASGTYQFVVATEVAHWKTTRTIQAEKVFQGFMSCVPDVPGTVVIIESTANGEGNLYHQTYKGAITFEDLKAGRIPPGWNGFIKVFYAWHEHPDYTSEVTEEESRLLLATLSEREKELMKLFPKTMTLGRIKWRRKKIAGVDFRGNETKFEEEYPSDEDSAFLVTGGRVFDQRRLKLAAELAASAPVTFGCLDMQGNVRGEYVAFRSAPEADSWLKVWEKPEPGMRYLITVDPMTGRAVGDDPDNHSILVLRMGFYDMHGRWRPTRLVARATDCGEEMSLRLRKGKYLAACRWALDVMHPRVAMLSKWYGGCIVCPEVNKDPGLTPLLVADGVPVYRQQKYNRVEDKDVEFWGWETTTENRDFMINTLHRMIRNMDVEGDGIQIEDEVVIQECRVFVRLKDGRTEAMGGWHDDQVLGLSIGVSCEAQATLMRETYIQRTDELTEIERRRMGHRRRDSTFA